MKDVQHLSARICSYHSKSAKQWQILLMWTGIVESILSCSPVFKLVTISTHAPGQQRDIISVVVAENSEKE